jgi:hypothetical protein
MIELKMFRSCTLVLLALGTAGTGWASVAGCGTTLATQQALSFYGAASAANGCFQDDLSYTNLSLSGGGSTGGGVSPTAANLDIYSTGTAASGNTIGSVSLFVDGFASIASGGTSSETGMVGLQASANTGTVGSVTYTAPTTAGLHWAYTTLTFAPAVAAVGAGDTVTITENFCLNASQAITGNGCVAADQGKITATFTGSTTAVFTCSFGTAGICLSASSGGVDFGTLPFAPTTIAITDLVNITRVTGTTVTLTNFENTFGESSFTPEPASFGLMGAALATLFALGYRRPKRKS